MEFSRAAGCSGHWATAGVAEQGLVSWTLLGFCSGGTTTSPERWRCHDARHAFWWGQPQRHSKVRHGDIGNGPVPCGSGQFPFKMTSIASPCYFHVQFPWGLPSSVRAMCGFVRWAFWIGWRRAGCDRYVGRRDSPSVCSQTDTCADKSDMFFPTSDGSQFFLIVVLVRKQHVATLGKSDHRWVNRLWCVGGGVSCFQIWVNVVAFISRVSLLSGLVGPADQVVMGL